MNPSVSLTDFLYDEVKVDESFLFGHYRLLPLGTIYHTTLMMMAMAMKNGISDTSVAVAESL